MGKLLDRLNKQLNTEYKEDAENCLLIYNKLKENTGHVWESDWRPLVTTIFKGFPSDERRFKPTVIGETFIKGILKTTYMKDKQYWMCIIGGTNPNKYKGNGADYPLRNAVRSKYFEIFGNDEVCSSGWGINEERYETLRNLHLKSTTDLKKALEYLEKH